MANLLPYLGMVIVVLTHSGNVVVSKVAISDGFNKYVMVVYSFALSTLILFPCAFLFSRSERPPVTFSAFCRFFPLGFFGCSAQILSFVGVDLSSPTLATALLNLIPAFTFVLALIFRMEEVHWRHSSSQAKVMGTIVSIAGASVVIFYKGPTIFKLHSSVSYSNVLFSPQLKWIMGGIYLTAECFFVSLLYIYQASVMKKYPAVMVVVFFQLFFSTIISAVFSFFAVTDKSAWVLKLNNMGLVAISYQAIAANAVRHFLIIWCVHKTGPVFCAMFKPIGIIFTVTMDVLFRGDDFHLGSLVGAVIIVIGFYCMMWAKAKEGKKVKQGIENLEACGHKCPTIRVDKMVRGSTTLESIVITDKTFDPPGFLHKS
ncbi:hypothetical protein L6164_027223 [Bauhinia variegata]|uniref:Uncharacterized protein n=1 Tax=Bauhinia variegata TaxID=167791 RepID=A0ACB9LTY7_BAUVA|nr:hypothetical protein L6164_027223 [Bauhinia variegata]